MLNQTKYLYAFMFMTCACALNTDLSTIEYKLRVKNKGK